MQSRRTFQNLNGEGCLVKGQRLCAPGLSTVPLRLTKTVGAQTETPSNTSRFPRAFFAAGAFNGRDLCTIVSLRACRLCGTVASYATHCTWLMGWSASSCKCRYPWALGRRVWTPHVTGALGPCLIINVRLQRTWAYCSGGRAMTFGPPRRHEPKID